MEILVEVFWKLAVFVGCIALMFIVVRCLFSAAEQLVWPEED